LGIGGYEGAALIGEGGFACVYRARQPAFDRLVAVKVLSKVRIDQRALRQFDRERAAVGSLSAHPNIVTVYEGGVTGAGLPYLAMEYLPNGSMADRLARDGPLPWPEVAHIGVRLAGALQSAHETGILHRDVKPENVLMSGFGEPQLTDFGIARMLTAPDTRTVDQAVSVAHAAPEVLNGEGFSRRSDVYSLGSTLFTLLWGRPPFLRDDDELLLPLLVRISRMPLPDLRAHGVPDAMCRALEGAMAKQPEDRPASARELAESLQHAQREQGLPVTVPFLIGAGLPPAPAIVGSHERPTPVAGAATTDVPLPLTTPPQRRRRRARWAVVGVPLVAVVVMMATLRGGEDHPSADAPVVTTETTPPATVTTAVATTTTVSAVPFPSGTEPVRGGRYVATRFTSPFEFGLPEGWRATDTSVEQQLELVRVGGDGGSALTFMDVSQVLDPQLAPASSTEARSAVRPAPGDLVQWLRAHPRLTAGDALPVTKGALAGTAIELQVSLGYANPACEAARAGRRCVLLFVNTEAVFYGLSEGYRARLHLLRLGQQTLVVAVEAPVADFDRFAPVAEQVMATLRSRS
jgi:hypothetical protein